MKILILSDIEAGGEWIATQTLIEKLKKNDKSIKFYLVAPSESQNLIKKSLFKKIICTQDKSFKKPFKYYRELIYKVINGMKIINEMCKDQTFDSIIAIDYILAISYVISQKKLNYIFYFHGIKNYFKITPEAFNHFMIFKKFLEILAWIMSKKIIIPSVNAKVILNQYSFFMLKRKTFIVLPNLIRDEFNNQYLKTNIENKKNILYSGRLDPNKGIRNLLYAFLRLTNKYPELVLVIAYFGKPEIKLLNEIKIFINKGQKIKLLNNLKTINLAKFYRFTCLGVLPSSLEISSLFVQEAFMCNLPIITTNTGNSDKILSKHFILKDSKIGTIYNKINDFLNNEYAYKKYFRKVADDFKSQYNEKTIIKSWIKVIKKNET